MIRKAEAGDAEAIADLWNWMIRDTLATFTTEEKTAAELASRIAAADGGFFVDEVDAVCRGFVTFGPFRPGPGYATTCELSVVVSPRFQGHKIGAALVKKASQAAHALGRQQMVAAISSANPQAVAFHDALGFSKVGHMPRVGFKSGQWLDLILMQKNLTESG